MMVPLFDPPPHHRQANTKQCSQTEWLWTDGPRTFFKIGIDESVPRSLSGCFYTPHDCVAVMAEA